MTINKKPGFSLFFLILTVLLVSLVAFLIGYFYSKQLAQDGHNSESPPRTSSTVTPGSDDLSTTDRPDNGTSTTIKPTDKPITNFDECEKAGYAIMESYPEQCRTPDGKTFTRYIGNEIEMAEMISINTPRPGQEMTSPLLIDGLARGSWYFEGSFPVKLKNSEDELIASGIATTKDDWMTEDLVSYSAELKFKISSPTKATLILEKDNPSGLPENDASLLVPIILVP